MRNFIIESLNEGLIMSYDINKCLPYLKKTFNCVLDGEFLIENPYYPQNKFSNNDFFKLRLDKDFYQYKDVIKKCNDLFGWFCSYINVRLSFDCPEEHFDKTYKFERRKDGNYFYENDSLFLSPDINIDVVFKKKSKWKNKIYSVNIILFDMFFEAKFGEEIKFPPKTKLYHFTKRKQSEKSNLDNYFNFSVDSFGAIQRKGCINPKSHGSHPERIYLSKNLNDLFDLSSFFNDRNLVFLEIETDDSMKFYVDPRRDFSVFTYDTIPLNKIKIIDLDKTKKYGKIIYEKIVDK